MLPSMTVCVMDTRSKELVVKPSPTENEKKKNNNNKNKKKLHQQHDIMDGCTISSLCILI